MVISNAQLRSNVVVNQKTMDNNENYLPIQNMYISNTRRDPGNKSTKAFNFKNIESRNRFATRIHDNVSLKIRNSPESTTKAPGQGSKGDICISSMAENYHSAATNYPWIKPFIKNASVSCQKSGVVPSESIQFSKFLIYKVLKTEDELNTWNI